MDIYHFYHESKYRDYLGTVGKEVEKENLLLVVDLTYIFIFCNEY